MMIGPEPMMRIFEMSVRLGISFVFKGHGFQPCRIGLLKNSGF